MEFREKRKFDNRMIGKEFIMNKTLLEKALEMPPNERVVFAELILASIDYEKDEILQEWIAEVKNRMAAVKEGKAKLLDFEGLYNEG
jgi:putative addiction module component (TIGR02574 family)